MSCCAIQVTTVHSWDLPSLSWVMQEHLRGHRASFRCPECTLHPSIFNAPVTRSSSHEVIRGTRCRRTAPVLWKQWYSSTTLFVFPETAAAWTTFTPKCGFGTLDPFWRRNFTYSVFAQHHTHWNSSRSRHERKHSTKYNLGQRITFPMVGGPSWKVCAFAFQTCFSFWVVGMVSRLMDSPWGAKSSVYPLEGGNTGNISHTALLALPELSRKDKGTKFTHHEMTALLQTVLLIPAPGCFSMVHDKSPFSLRIMACVFVCFLTLIAVPPCIKLSQSIWSSVSVNLGSWHLGRNDGKYLAQDLIQHPFVTWSSQGQILRLALCQHSHLLRDLPVCAED